MTFLGGAAKDALAWDGRSCEVCKKDMLERKLSPIYLGITSSLDAPVTTVLSALGEPPYSAHFACCSKACVRKAISRALQKSRAFLQQRLALIRTVRH